MPARTKTKFTSKRLSASSKAYLTRQAADPYVQAARAEGYRSRAAYKLKEIDAKYHLLKPGQKIVDLGCAPGGWCQVAAEICGPSATIVGIDLLPTDPLAQCTFLEADFSSDAGLAELQAALQTTLATQQVDVVLSDMAANTIGHRASDGLRTMALVEMAAEFALQHLMIGGHFLTKLFMNGDEPKLRDSLRPHFEKVVFFKPPASRKDSRETYLLCLNRLTI